MVLNNMCVRNIRKALNCMPTLVFFSFSSYTQKTNVYRTYLGLISEGVQSDLLLPTQFLGHNVRRGYGRPVTGAAWLRRGSLARSPAPAHSRGHHLSQVVGFLQGVGRNGDVSGILKMIFFFRRKSIRIYSVRIYGWETKSLTGHIVKCIKYEVWHIFLLLYWR